VGYLARHAGRRPGDRDIALLDVCQDYALDYLDQQGIFGFGVALKGGTSLRKFRAGNAGRFSTDLDFATPDAETAGLVLDTLDGAEHFDVRMSVIDREELRGRILFQTPLGQPVVPAKIELSPRPLWLPAPRTMPVTLPVHSGYEFTQTALPVPAIEESIAEKLAAWLRRRKMRDLYDLHWYGSRAMDEVLVRRLFVLKVWHDIVHDGLGTGPLDPARITGSSGQARIVHEHIGLLTQPVEPDVWLVSIRRRYSFVESLDNDERRVARCSQADSYFVAKLVASLTSRQTRQDPR
jgi:uncharacterized protein